MPEVTVEVWSNLSHRFGAERGKRHCLDVEVEDGTTLGQLLRKLADENPMFAEVAYKPNTREPSEHVAAVINDRLPELLEGYETRLRGKDRVILVQAYAGG